MSSRGGRRRKWILHSDAVVSCVGRWGRRRVRVEQCAATLTAEGVYGHLVCDRVPFRPWSRLTISWLPPSCGAAWRIDVDVRPNAVWRRGRMFLGCPRCRRRVTRLYIPVAACEPRCRRCYGLNYESQSWSYKACGALGLLFGPVAYVTTDARREQRKRASRARYAARRRFL